MTEDDNLSNPIICSYCIGQDGQLRAIDDDSPDSQSEEMTWHHIDASHPKVAWLLEEKYDLDSVVINGLLVKDARPRLLSLEKGFLLILKGVNDISVDDVEDLVSVRMWVEKKRIFTLSKRPLTIFDNFFSDIERGVLVPSIPEIMIKFVGLILKGYEEIIENIEERIDSEEDSLLDDYDNHDENTLSLIRRQAIILRRFLVPQKDVLRQLTLADYSWMSSKQHNKLKQQLDWILRNVEDIDMVRDRAKALQEEKSRILSEKTSKLMYVFALVTVVFLPLSFFTGLFGINVGGIPGAHNPWGFYWFGLFAVASALTTILALRKIPWFK
ncbi:MAG: CorA family divalent cation transporter [Chlamydiota bacterium]